MQFTQDQRTAIEKVTEFFRTPIDAERTETYLYTLAGSAGTGKTTLTKEFIKLARGQGMQVIAVAPTHKARKVLHNIINKTFIRTPTCTVSALLGKTKVHSFVGTKHYKGGDTTKMGLYDLILLDEVSMTTSQDFTDISNLARQFKKKVLFIGDSSQIPHPSQKHELLHDGEGHAYLAKSVNPAFSISGISQLTEITRNKGDNKLLGLYGYLREHIGADIKIAKAASDTGGDGITVSEDGQMHGYLIIHEQDKFLSLIAANAKEFLNGMYKVISYTNNSVQQYNKLLREKLGHRGLLVQGDILMGYNNIGNACDYIIENGQDYVVQQVTDTAEHSLAANGKSFSGLAGKLVHINELHGQGKEMVKIFMPDLENDCNNAILEELVHLSSLVNRQGSSGTDYRKYIALKSQLIFMENIYQYNHGIYTEKDFELLHPLLCTKTADVVQEVNGNTPRRVLIDADLREKVEQTYPGLITRRILDNKEISINETLADQFQILEKDVDYGYAITAHKSQGSTYSVIFLDESNFNSLRDGWSVRYGCPIRRATERDQLKYVSLTRPKFLAYVYSL